MFLSFVAYLLKIEHISHDYNHIIVYNWIRALLWTLYSYESLGFVNCPEIFSRDSFKTQCS